MSGYSQNITVSFDLCALREHGWAISKFGLAALVGVSTCVRCGARDYLRFEAGKLSEQNWQDWLKSIPDPVEPVV